MRLVKNRTQRMVNRQGKPEGAGSDKRSSGWRWLCGSLGMALAWLAGCGGDPYVGSFAQEKPAREDLIGEWRGSFNLCAQETYGKGRTARLVLREDGSFVIGDMLESISKRRYRSGDGLWSLKYWDLECPRWQVVLHFPPGEHRPGHAYHRLNVLHENPPHKLVQMIDDPDTGNAVVYRRAR